MLQYYMYVFEINLNKIEFDKYGKFSIFRCKLEYNMDFNFLYLVN